MRCARCFTRTASHSADLLRKLMTMMMMIQCNHRTMSSLPLFRAFPAIASLVMPAPCHLEERAHRDR